MDYDTGRCDTGGAGYDTGRCDMGGVYETGRHTRGAYETGRHTRGSAGVGGEGKALCAAS